MIDKEVLSESLCRLETTGSFCDQEVSATHGVQTLVVVVEAGDSA